jgi:two-component system cell cycle sensor histidine kinase/response regulator CckA
MSADRESGHDEPRQACMLCQDEAREDRLRMLFDLESDAVLVIDNETGRILEANAAASQLYGYPPYELRTLYNTDLSAEPGETRRVTTTTEVNDEQVVHIPVRFHKKKDGTVFPTEITGRFFSDHGRSVHLAAIRDITERWRAERALQDSEERFRTILESAPDGVFVEVDQRFAYANATAVRLFGAGSPEDLLGRSVLDLAHPDCRERIHECFRLTNEERRSMPPTEQMYLRLDGQSVPVELSTAPITYLQKPGALVFVRDIASRKRLEAEAAQAGKLDSIGQIAGGIAHDFNNMLNVIGGYTELALTRLRLEDPLRAQLEEVRQAAAKATELTKQLLTFSRRRVNAPLLVDLNAHLQVSDALMRGVLGDTIRLERTLSQGSAMTRVDPAQFDQLLFNLLANARDAMPDGGTVAISTSVVPPGAGHPGTPSLCPSSPCVRLSITDTGCGMDATTRERAFEPFFTTHSPSGGTGLGLAVVYGIVKQHHGHVSLASTPGGGATVNVFLPVAEDEPAPVGLGDVARTGPACGQEVILVVEDEDQVRRLVAAALVRSGYTVLQAASPERALEIAGTRSGPIDLLLTDVVMPGMSGPELQQQLLNTRRNLPTLFMSGYVANEMRGGHILDEDVSFIQKPFSVAELTRTVRTMLDRRA